MNKRLDILNGKILKTLVLLSFPILVCGLFQQLYNVVDTMIIGRFVGGTGIAVVGGSCSMLITLFNGTSTGLITGSIIVVANHYGARNEHQVQQDIETSIIIAVIGGLAIMLVYMLFAQAILTFLQVPAALVKASAQYLMFYAIGFPFCFVFQMLINIFRAMGEAKRPTRYLIGSFLLNIIFDFLFVVVFKLNEKGVALAYIVTQVISAGVAMRNLSLATALRLKDLKPDPQALQGILKIGIPSSLTSLLYAFTNILIQSSINLLGSEAIAGFAINVKVENLFWTIMTGIGFALTTFIGQNYGARNLTRIRQSIKTSLALAFGITFMTSILIYTQRFLLASIFTTDPALLNIGTRVMAFMSPMYCTYTFIEILSGILKGMGKAIGPTLITLTFICGIRATYVVFYALQHLSIETVLWAYPLSWTVTSLVFIIYFLIVKRRVLDVKRDPIAV